MPINQHSRGPQVKVSLDCIARLTPREREEGRRGRKAGRSQKRTKWGKVSSSLVGRGLA